MNSIKTKLTGYDLLNNSRLNKGTAFTESERDTFALHGLLPSHIGTLEDQRERRHRGLADLPTPLEKYSFMRYLQDKNASLLPPLANIRSVSLEVAKAVGKQAIRDGLAEVDEAGFEKELAANIWDPVYKPYERAG